MKSEFKTKLIQHMLNKKNGEKAFTLLELLVLIIIIGILAAIALPSFLSQSNKAKQSEAKTYVGTLNKGQQAYYTEKGRFGANLYVLAVGVKASTPNYPYAVTASSDSQTASNNKALSVGNPTAVALRAYGGMVSLNVVSSTSDVTSLAILCENNIAGGTAVSPVSTGLSTGPSCDTSSQAVGQ